MTLNLVLVATGLVGLSALMSVLIVMSQHLHGKHTLDHDVDGVQKFHVTAVPRIGGAAIYFAILAGVAICSLSDSRLITRVASNMALLLLIAGLPTFLAGLVEDMTKRVSVRTRLCASMGSALVASWLLGATVDHLNMWGIDLLLAWAPFAIAVTMLVVAGGVNAINIIDGFNGLAGATVIVMLVALGTVGWQVGDHLIMELAVLGVAGTAGFLLINYPTGRLFLGDGGAYFLGFWVSETAVLLLVRNDSVSAWQVLAICAYPIIEVIYSIYRRKIVRKASPGSPDGLHLHTLVYRRVVSRLFVSNSSHPWKRNAAVACVMIPWIAGAALLAVLSGSKGISSIAVVGGEVLLYLVVYRRVVTGRWLTRSSDASCQVEERLGKSSR